MVFHERYVTLTTEAKNLAAVRAQFSFYWDRLAPSGLSGKDLIALTSFRFGGTLSFRIGETYRAVRNGYDMDIRATHS